MNKNQQQQKKRIVYQEHLLLCPFRLHTEPKTIKIEFPIHIQCLKINENDRCLLIGHSDMDRVFDIRSGERKK